MFHSLGGIGFNNCVSYVGRHPFVLGGEHLGTPLELREFPPEPTEVGGVVAGQERRLDGPDRVVQQAGDFDELLVGGTLRGGDG